MKFFVTQADLERRNPGAYAYLGTYQRVPLTTGQHILHLLLTVFTCGLWAPVWIIRAVRGNLVRRQPPLAGYGQPGGEGF